MGLWAARWQVHHGARAVAGQVGPHAAAGLILGGHQVYTADVRVIVGVAAYKQEGAPRLAP